jgi:hypothetical protein
MDLAEELLEKARAEARRLGREELTPAALDALRVESADLFEALPEPPAYRKLTDPVRTRAGELLPRATSLLARLLASRAVYPDDVRLSRLGQAVEKHLRALAAMSGGEITLGDTLAREAWEAARSVTASGSFFQLEGQERRKVYDRSTGHSRYDARPEPMLTVQLFCADASCRHPSPYSVAPRYAVHRFTCVSCKKPFTGHFAEIRSAEARPGGGAVHHVLRVLEVGGGERVLEFDDASGGDLLVAPRDLVVLLYSFEGALAAVENLSTGRVLWVTPKRSCFLATAAFGEDAPELDAFRAFRDRRLMVSRSGRWLVRLYYRVSPPLASVVARRPRLRRAVRAVLAFVHVCTRVRS